MTESFLNDVISYEYLVRGTIENFPYCTALKVWIGQFSQIVGAILDLNKIPDLGVLEQNENFGSEVRAKNSGSAVTRLLFGSF